MSRVRPSPVPPVEGIFPLELIWVLTAFPKTPSDESINQGLVCAHMHSIVILVVEASMSRAAYSGFDSRLHQDFSGLSHTSDLKIGTSVATLPGAWRYGVSTRTGRPGVSIL